MQCSAVQCSKVQCSTAEFRRAAAYMSLGKYKLALKDYEGVFKARPADKDAKMKYTECKKIVQQMAFQKVTGDGCDGCDG